MLGYCAHEAGSHATALDLLGDSIEALPLVADLAAYLAADSAFQEDAFEAAIALTLLLPDNSVYGPRAQFLRGRAMRQGGRALEAVGVLTDFSTRYPRASYIAEVELELAAAQAQTGSAVEAARLYQRISVRYPGSSARPPRPARPTHRWWR